MDLNKHIYKNNDSRVFHSNGYAEVANKNSFGTDGNIPFGQRRQIDQNRHVVPGYRNSSIGNAHGQVRINTVPGEINRRTQTLSKSQVQQLKQSGILSRSQVQQLQSSSQRGGSFNIPTRQFQEPTARTFNPYR